MDWPGGGFYVTYGHDNTGAVTAIHQNGSLASADLIAGFGYNDLGLRSSSGAFGCLVYPWILIADPLGAPGDVMAGPGTPPGPLPTMPERDRVQTP